MVRLPEEIGKSPYFFHTLSIEKVINWYWQLSEGCGIPCSLFSKSKRGSASTESCFFMAFMCYWFGAWVTFFVSNRYRVMVMLFPCTV